MDMTNNSINDWMTGVKASMPQPLPDNKGIVVVIHPPQTVKTKFGDSQKCSITINSLKGDETINVGMFLPKGFPFISPMSNLGKILTRYDCTTLQELIGKTVEVEEVEGHDMLWNIKGGA